MFTLDMIYGMDVFISDVLLTNGYKTLCGALHSSDD